MIRQQHSANTFHWSWVTYATFFYTYFFILFYNRTFRQHYHFIHFVQTHVLSYYFLKLQIYNEKNIKGRSTFLDFLCFTSFTHAQASKSLESLSSSFFSLFLWPSLLLLYFWAVFHGRRSVVSVLSRDVVFLKNWLSGHEWSHSHNSPAK